MGGGDYKFAADPHKTVKKYARRAAAKYHEKFNWHVPQPGSVNRRSEAPQPPTTDAVHEEGGFESEERAAEERARHRGRVGALDVPVKEKPPVHIVIERRLSMPAPGTSAWRKHQQKSAVALHERIAKKKAV